MKLFNLFKEDTIKDVFIVENSVQKSEEEIIELIHNEFNTAPDRLVEEAYKIINKGNSIVIDKKLEDKATTLKNLGFKNSVSVKSFEEQEKLKQSEDNKIRMSEELAKIILHYKNTYPFAKFITNTERDRICLEYGLIYAPVHTYIKDIPDKNIKEIKNGQQVKLEDIIENCIIKEEYTIFGKDQTLVSYKYAIRMYEENGAPKFIGNTINDVKRYLSENRRYSRYSHSYSDRHVNYDLNEDLVGFYIAAPKDHFNLSGYQLDSKFGYSKPLVKDDPIVFKKVKGGNLIFSMWGKESEDEILINPINN